MAKTAPLKTPDGRYIIVRGRLWRATNPNLPEADAARHRQQLGQARSDIAKANRTDDDTLRKDARGRVHQAKLALGERGPVWWPGDAPDLTRHLIKNTPYADWWSRQEKHEAD